MRQGRHAPAPNAGATFYIPPDPLSQATEVVRLRSLFLGIMRATPPWAMTVKTRGGIRVFLPTHGTFYVTWVEGAQVPPTIVNSGDVLVLPRGGGFRIQDSPHTPSDIDRLPEQLLHGSVPTESPDLEWIGMTCFLDSTHGSLLTDFLPHVMCLSKGAPGLKQWLNPTIELFRSEYERASPGRGAILSRMAEIVCVQAIRIWIEQAPQESRGWLRALKDEHIGAALHAIHEDPGTRWTVESLARHVGLSRTVFATRFKSLVGESPMMYVTRWRMHRALALLQHQRSNVKAIAGACGYRSVGTFRQNFKRHFGGVPGKHRNGD